MSGRPKHALAAFGAPRAGAARASGRQRATSVVSRLGGEAIRGRIGLAVAAVIGATAGLSWCAWLLTAFFVPA